MRKAICMFALGAIAAGVLVAQEKLRMKAPPAFETLKMLVGTWEGPNPEGGIERDVIRLISNGTAIEEIVQARQDNQMVTIYAPDGERIAMTHFCSIGNQPRMGTKATTANQKEFDFTFSGGTNIAGPDDPQMNHLLLRIVDKDHFIEVWGFSMKGKVQQSTIQFMRKS
ncbi:MAG: hypothetical protein ACRD5M_08475 [Candidatus Acidiferrales bacterium]